MRTLTLLAVLLAASMATPAAAQYAPQVGKLHPDFTLPTISSRKPVSLAQFRGQRILLIHFASW